MGIVWGNRFWDSCGYALLGLNCLPVDLFLKSDAHITSKNYGGTHKEVPLMWIFSEVTFRSCNP